MRLFIILAATVLAAVLALAVGGESAAQDAPDCTACAQECAGNAQECRAAAEDRTDECLETCYPLGLEDRRKCLTACAETRNSEVRVCDRQQEDCVSNCSIRSESATSVWAP